MLLQARKSLVNATGTYSGGLPTSLDFGVLNIGQYSRLTGMVLVDSVPTGTAVLNLRYQVQSGTTVVASTFSVASGGTVFSDINPAQLASVSITNVVSNSNYKLSLNGEVVR
jgi:hypothetical protein